MNFKELVQPYKCFDKNENRLSLLRIGRNEDGGYIVPEIAVKASDVLFSYGINYETSFEEDYQKHFSNQKIYMFDHTINHCNFHNDNAIWIKEGIGSDKNCNQIQTQIKQLGSENKNIFIKIDVEGAEYEAFDKFNDYENITGIVCEFHWLDREDCRNKFINTITKLNKYFDIVHIHGNNCQSMVNIDGFMFPIVPEISFINKKLVSSKDVLHIEYPTEIDFPNGKSSPDLKIAFI